MDQSIEYVHIMSNYDSAYNVPPNAIKQPLMNIPTSSSIMSPTFSNHPSSPFFHRCKSPSARIPLSTESGPKFNFDLYKMNESNYDFDRDSLSSSRSISPMSSNGICHHPMYSSLPYSNSKLQALSKLHQINDELSQTLARSEMTDGTPVHYHVHHYPLDQITSRNYRSKSTSREHSLSTDIEMSPKMHKARVTYKVHIPRRHLQYQQHMKTSDMYCNDEPVIVDLYPTRDQGFVKQRRKASDYHNPWIVNGTAIRRNSYSDTNTSQCSETPRESFYENRPMKSRHRSTRRTEHPSSATSHRSPYKSSRTRPDSARFYPSDPYQESNTSFSKISPKRHTSSSKKQSKYVDSHIRSSKSKSSPNDTPRSQVSSSRTRRSQGHPPSKTTTKKRDTDETESESVLQRKPHSDQTKSATKDSNSKNHIDNSESKVKSAWEPTVIGVSKSTDRQSTPKPTTIIHENASHNESTKSVVELAPKTQTVVDENHTNFQKDSSRKQSPELEKPKIQESSRSSPRTEKPPISKQPQKPSTELSNATNGMLAKEHDANNSQDNNHTSLPTSNTNKTENTNSNIKEISDDDSTDQEQSEHSSKVAKPDQSNQLLLPKHEEKSAVISDDDADENDREVAQTFDFNKFLVDASKAILGPAKTSDVTKPSQAQLKPTVKSLPRQKVQQKAPTSAGSDQELYNPPFGPKKNNQPPVIPVPVPPLPPAASSSSQPLVPPTTEQTNVDDADDFFS